MKKVILLFIMDPQSLCSLILYIINAWVIKTNYKTQEY